MGLKHYADGEECTCDMVYSEDPQAYIEAHKAKAEKTGGRWPKDLSYNQTIDEAKKLRAVTQHRGY